MASSMNKAYVVCPEKITGPHASLQYSFMSDNVPCGCKVSVPGPAAVMELRCPRGHIFYATNKDIRGL